MNWNFDYTIPSLIVLLFFLIFYFLKPVLLTQSNRIYLSLIITEVFGFFITVFSCFADNNSSTYSRFVLVTLDNFYYITFIVRYFLVSIFFAFLLKVKIKKDIPTILVSIVITATIVLICLNPWTEIVYKFTPDGKFERGDHFLFIYYANFSTLLLDLYYLLRFHKNLDKKGIISYSFSTLGLFACSFMDIFYVDYLITDMFFLFVILILFITFENPDTFIDKKTGLFNFHAFSSVVHEFLFREKKYSIISFIIKNYPEKKQIYGVKQMDLALKEVGKFFQSSFHGKKAFYLQNGQFAIIDNNTKNFPEITETIIKRFQTPWKVNNSYVHIDIFVVDIDEDIYFNSMEDITAGYGVAYNEAKQASVNHITIKKNAFNEIIRKTKVAKALNYALINDSLLVYMQPIVEASTGKIVAAEALVRIHDDELGVIPPVEFITMAEKNGSIEFLGEQVLNKVCIFLKESHINNFGIQWINVNLSPVQCQNNQLPNKIDNIANINKIDHKFIHLEITEDSMIDLQILARQMELLITNGYKFSLDDFGSGFSNITRVKKFPFYNIKLDMSLITDYFKAPDNMLPGIIKIFKERGLSLTAEGVETKEMADALADMGCDYLQGYYFSKPIPMDEFKNLVINSYK